jgi:hypothetical protein
MVTLMVLLVAGSELMARLPRLSALASGRVGSLVLGLGALFLLVANLRAQADPSAFVRDPRSVDIERLTAEVRARATQDIPGRRFLFRVAPHHSQATAIGLVLALDKAGLRFGVEPFGSCRYEGRFRPRGDEWAELLIGDLPARQGARRLGEGGTIDAAWQMRRLISSAPADAASPRGATAVE